MTLVYVLVGTFWAACATCIALLYGHARRINRELAALQDRVVKPKTTAGEIVERQWKTGATAKQGWPPVNPNKVPTVPPPPPDQHR